MLGTVLHVDPDAAARHARSVVLGDAGFDLIEAASAADALSLAAEKQPSLSTCSPCVFPIWTALRHAGY